MGVKAGQQRQGILDKTAGAQTTRWQESTINRLIFKS
jgi:hypothetical protein